jgi:hypothetical protein
LISGLKMPVNIAIIATVRPARAIKLALEEALGGAYPGDEGVRL